jgi:hypothetical protein
MEGVATLAARRDVERSSAGKNLGLSQIFRQHMRPDQKNGNIDKGKCCDRDSSGTFGDMEGFVESNSSWWMRDLVLLPCRAGTNS